MNKLIFLLDNLIMKFYQENSQHHSYISKYRNIETVLQKIPSKMNVPPDFDYQKARQLFKKDVDIDVFKRINIKYGVSESDINTLMSFLSLHKIKKDKIHFFLSILLDFQLANNVPSSKKDVIVDSKVKDKKNKKNEKKIDVEKSQFLLGILTGNIKTNDEIYYDNINNQQ